MNNNQRNNMKGLYLTNNIKQEYTKIFSELNELNGKDDIFCIERYCDEGKDLLKYLKRAITWYNQKQLEEMKSTSTNIIFYYTTKEYIIISKIDLQKGIDMDIVDVYDKVKMSTPNVKMTRKKLDLNTYLNSN
jgi:dGTP triphosphohydrolase